MMYDMVDLVTQALKGLQEANVQLDAGLSDVDISRIEEQFDFTFCREHRQFLQLAVPTGEPSWPGWRYGSLEDLQGRLDWPIDGVIFDVHNNAFWPASWGRRPRNEALAEREARAHLARVPKLVPIYSHRYLPADPAPVPSPVFSVYQTDVVYYGDNLLDYVAHEFGGTAGAEITGKPPYVRFWTDLVRGAESADL
jgi:hypothetical protein